MRFTLGVLHLRSVKCLKLRVRLCLFRHTLIDVVVRHSGDNLHVPFEYHAAFVLTYERQLAFESRVEYVSVVSFFRIETVFRFGPHH